MKGKSAVRLLLFVGDLCYMMVDQVDSVAGEKRGFSLPNQSPILCSNQNVVNQLNKAGCLHPNTATALVGLLLCLTREKERKGKAPIDTDDFFSTERERNPSKEKGNLGEIRFRPFSQIMLANSLNI